jgi:hypothetical protein
MMRQEDRDAEEIKKWMDRFIARRRAGSSQRNSHAGAKWDVGGRSAYAESWRNGSGFYSEVF